MVTLTTCSNLDEAYLLKARLEGSGIEAFLPDEFLSQNDWGCINALGGVRVQVQPEDVNTARDILGETRRQQAEPLEILTCPDCGSHDVQQDTTNRGYALLSLILFCIPLPFSRKRFVCDACGHQWKQ